jgi:small neutral amino acid transporter SnatA (MarC family)
MSLLVSSIATFFAMCNPFANTPIFMLSGDTLEKKLGQSGITALTKIMGLILLTIGVQIFLGGLDSVLNEYIPTTPSLLSSSGSSS